MWIVSALISICRRANVFCLILLMLVNLQQYCGEIGAFYNRFSKYTFVQYSYKFNNILIYLLLLMLSCLAFYFVIFIKALKNCTGYIFKISIISLHLLISYSFIYNCGHSHHISLCGDIELNPGLKQNINPCFLVYHWNFNSIASHNFSSVFNCLQLYT